jgi:hypothetical protein
MFLGFEAWASGLPGHACKKELACLRQFGSNGTARRTSQEPLNIKKL